ncbi:hypothetical protein ACQBAR_13745 [Propionibacteriaceae bacterium Y1685]
MQALRDRLDQAVQQLQADHGPTPDPEPIDYELSSLPALRIIGHRVRVEASDPTSAAVSLLNRIEEVLATADTPFDRPVAVYDDRDGHLTVTAGQWTDESASDSRAGLAVPGLEVITFPVVPRAACVIHHGEPTQVNHTWQALQAQLDAEGHEPAGACRQVHFQPWNESDRSAWRIELQQPLQD